MALLKPSRLALAAAAAALTFVALEPAAFAQQTPANKSDPKKDDKKGQDKKAPAEPEKKAEEKKPEGDKKVEAAASTDAKDGKVEEEHAEKRAIYLNVEGGVARMDFAGISDSTSLDRTGANGLSYGIGAGVRFGQLRLGARFRGFGTTEFEMWSGMAEVGYGLGTIPFEPVFFLRAGYAWSIELERATMASSLPAGNILPPEVHVRGLTVGGEVFGGYWVNHIVRLGPFIGADLLFVNRAQAELPTSALPGQLSDEIRGKALYNEDGSGIGYAINLGLRGAVDLGF